MSDSSWNTGADAGAARPPRVAGPIGGTPEPELTFVGGDRADIGSG